MSPVANDSADDQAANTAKPRRQQERQRIKRGKEDSLCHGDDSLIAPNLASLMQSESSHGHVSELPLSSSNQVSMAGWITANPQQSMLKSTAIQSQKDALSMTQQEKDRLAKQRAMHGSVPPTSLQESMYARYQAVGMIMGEDGPSQDFHVEDQDDLIRQSTRPTSAISVHSLRSHDLEPDHMHMPEAEEVVRERFRAATVALQGDVSELDEEQQLKHREKEEREFLVSAGSAAMTNARLSPADRQAKASPTHSSNDNTALSQTGETTVVTVTAFGGTTSSTNTTRCTRQPMAPGALCVSQGTVEQLDKTRVTQTVEMMQEGEITRPSSSNAPRTATSAPSASYSTPSASHESFLSTQPVERTDVPLAEAAPAPLHADSERSGASALNEKAVPQERSFIARWWKWILAATALTVIAAGVGGGIAAASGSGGDDASFGSAQAVVPTVSPTVSPTFLETQRSRDIQAALVEAGVSTPETLDASRSAQKKALGWIANKDTTYSDLEDLETLTERYISAVFYYSLDGENWNDEWSDWLNDDADVCDWLGVTCASNANSKNVIQRIEFPPTKQEATSKDEAYSVGLQGPIPSEMESLTGLRTLRLLNNAITGIHGPIPQLELLQLGYNDLEFSALAPVFSMTNLRVLDLSANNLVGTITNQIQQLVGLQVLDLQQNSLEGEFVHLYKGLTGLVRIDIRWNNFRGTIPFSFSELTDLNFFRASDTFLSGSIPDTLWELTNLGVLDVENLGLEGTLSPNMGSAVALQQLYLNGNQFAGTIPTEIGLLGRLQLLRLGNNLLTGFIPTEIGRLVNLRDIGLDGNQLEGPIPTEIASATTLDELRLHSNSLSGTLPTEFGALTELNVLNVGFNVLEGSIPLEYGSLEQLGDLNVQGNVGMTGSVPVGVCELPNVNPIQVASTGIGCGNCDNCL